MTSTTREIARDSIRDRLTQVVLEQVVEHGYDAVTLNSLADAAGVSRSTLLRYVGSKEDAVVGGVMAFGDHVAAALRGRPAAESAWVAVRRALDVVVDGHAHSGDHGLRITQTIYGNRALAGAMWLERSTWSERLRTALSERHPDADPADLAALSFLAIAALDTATYAWLADPQTPYATHLDAAFDAASRVAQM
jgi:AcrR family transcriptional regulator